MRNQLRKLKAKEIIGNSTNIELRQNVFGVNLTTGDYVVDVELLEMIISLRPMIAKWMIFLWEGAAGEKVLLWL